MKVKRLMEENDKIADLINPEPMLIRPDDMRDIYDIQSIAREVEIDWNKTRKIDRRGTVATVRNSKTDPKIQRNDPCSCGSGKKYKKCCM